MRGNRGFTLVELLAATAVLASLTGVVAIASVHAHETVNTTRCIANLKQWGTALGLYMADHDGQIPRRGQGVRPLANIDRPEDWFNCLPPYIGELPYVEQHRRGATPRHGERSIFVCPSAGKGREAYFLSYAMNMYLSPWIRPDRHRIQEIPSPSTLAFLADGPGGWASTVPSSQPYSTQARHDGSANILFVDGHVQTFSRDYLGCGKGNTSQPDIRWLTETDGVNQMPVP